MTEFKSCEKIQMNLSGRRFEQIFAHSESQVRECIDLINRGLSLNSLSENQKTELRTLMTVLTEDNVYDVFNRVWLLINLKHQPTIVRPVHPNSHMSTHILIAGLAIWSVSNILELKSSRNSELSNLRPVQSNMDPSINGSIYRWGNYAGICIGSAGLLGLIWNKI